MRDEIESGKIEEQSEAKAEGGKPEWQKPVTVALEIDEVTMNTHGGDSSETYAVYQS